MVKLMSHRTRLMKNASAKWKRWAISNTNDKSKFRFITIIIDAFKYDNNVDKNVVLSDVDRSINGFKIDFTRFMNRISDLTEMASCF